MAKQTSSVEQIVQRWRHLVATKTRKIISFEETILLKIESLKPWVEADVEPLGGWEIRQFHYDRKCNRQWLDADYRPIEVGQTWGGPEVSAMFRTSAVMPKRFAGKPVAMKLYFSGDGLLSVNGTPYHGLDPFRDTVPLTECAAGDERYELQAESFIRWHFGEGQDKTFECSHLAVIDRDIEAAYWDLAAAFFVATAEEEIEPATRQFILDGLTRAVQPIDQNAVDRDTVRRNAMAAREIIRREVYDRDLFRNAGLLHLCGHSHLDLVYVWPYSEFLRKIGRTHSTTLRLMEQYPEYIFSQSQPLLYKEMKRLYPALYEQVKQRVAEGRWEAIGAFWVEPDCNLISGESFVRQILHGTRFLRDEFGVTPKTAWIPDVFGNAWTMPQILVKCGLKYFVTHKMSMWNDTNRWTNSAFWWQGPDGSRIFATVPPTHFIGTMDPAHMREHWNNFTAKDTVGQSLYCYGWGDGGGGPDTLMLECARRYSHFPGLPATRMSTIEDALERMYQRGVEADLPVHNDELYLEEHRGVHTTKAKLKKINRRCETLYRKAELFNCLADGDYPAEELERGWEQLLTNQFHDSLPGTHLNEVYHDLLETYETVTAVGESALGSALQSLAGRADTRGPGRAMVVFNSRPYERDGRVRIDAEPRPLHVVGPDGKTVPHQVITDMENGASQLVFIARAMPACGFAVYRLVEGDADAPAPSSGVQADARTLENRHLRLQLNDRGELISLLAKKARRECIRPDRRGNVLQVFEDEPGKYDAWDIVSFYENYEFPLEGDVEMELVEAGPVRWAIEIRRPILSSSLRQRIVLWADSPRVDFETWADWKETHKLLKVRFHTTVVSRQATYDIAFGNIDRPTYANNPYEAARFEVPAHTWMDISQADFGLSLLNDCKYGHQAREDMICLSLLRSPKDPDPQSDMHEHAFTYSLLPHGGDWRKGATHRHAEDLNDPVDVVVADAHDGPLGVKHSFLELDGEAVTLEALKRAEDGDGWIVRLVERHGSQASVMLRFDRPIGAATECDLMERGNEPANLVDGALSLTANPYEIRTFRLQR